MLTPRALITILIGVLFLAALFPTINEQITGVDTSGWNFTGHSGGATLWDLIPFIVVAGACLGIVVTMLGKNQGGG